MMTKAEEMKIRLDYINDVQELKDIILQQAKEIDDFKKIFSEIRRSAD